jgi:type IV secretory pathway VirB2 component (pilin)
VSSVLTYPRIPAATPVRQFFWLHPEWWSVALCGFAWAVILPHGWQHAGHRVEHRLQFHEELLGWMLMVAAMMLPLVMHAVRIAASHSLWARRHRAIAGFLLGYFAPWLVVGVVVAGLKEGWWARGYLAAALGFVGSALWLRTPAHRRALSACHRTLPLAPVGWRADRDCMRYGGTIGFACVWSCWPLMLACAFAGHGLIAMTGGMVVSATERWSFRPRRRAAAMGTLAIASYYLVLAVLFPGFAMA